MFGLHPVAFWIAAGIAAALAITPLLFLLLDKAGKLTPTLRNDLWTRYKSWLFLAPLMVGPLLAGRLPAIIGVGVLSLACYREFARATGMFRYRAISAVVALGIVLLTFAAADQWYGFFVALSSLTISLLVIIALFADQPKGYIQRVALGIFAFSLFGVCLGHFGYFANDKAGQAFLVAILLCVELNDVFAYCTGKLFGRRKLAPQTSPNKTIGGAIGAAILTTALFAALVHAIVRGSVLDQPVHLIAMGLLLSLTGQFGDLVMSSIKRDLGVKDLGVTIPGHGGLLDRFDSLIFVGPAMFHYVNYFLGLGLDQAVRGLTGH
ncbi:MAG: phosphatidate cytidylyltransferase [Chthoniobacter sp.]|uniref:phosphatidate cytidylyltransferase n=1 Tax=Chthoniobacter sp. TaxID=2510640 RepID=UPI0032A5CAF0